MCDQPEGGENGKRTLQTAASVLFLAVHSHSSRGEPERHEITRKWAPRHWA